MKTTPVPEQFSMQSLMLWWMHRIAEDFKNKALLKGGMELALLESPRLTNDLDYVMVSFASKNEIEPSLLKIAKEIPGAEVTVFKNSKNLRLVVKKEDIQIQIEASVAKECKSELMTTISLARKENMLPKMIRVMSLEVAFSNKLAAWNERRLLRDVYDCYFLFQVQNRMPDLSALHYRLQKIESRIPKLKKLKRMGLRSFLTLFENEIGKISQKKLDQELKGLLPEENLFNLEQRIKTSMHNFVQKAVLELNRAGR